MQNGETDKIIQNLNACGCDNAIIERFMAMLNTGKKKEALSILATYRGELLNEFHKCDECISHLDFLVAQIGKQ